MQYGSEEDHFDICYAISKQDVRTIRDLISKRIDINASNSNGYTPLHCAVLHFGNLHVIEALLDGGANVHIRNARNNSPLHLVIQNDNIEAASLLITRGALFGEDLNSLINMAIYKNNEIITKLIIANGIHENPSVNLFISLKAAILKRNWVIIKDILPHCGFSKPCDLYIPRELVVDSDPRCSECLELLFKWNFTFDPNIYHDENFIYGAIENGHLSVVENFLKSGINVNMVNSKTTLNLLTIAYILLRHGVKMKDYTELFNLTCIAAKNGCEEIVQMFLEHGVQATDVTFHGKSLLHYCIHSNHSIDNDDRYEIAKLLIENGADIHLRIPGNSLVYQAISRRLYNIAQLFVEYYADVQYISLTGETSLCKAIKHSLDVNFIKTLLELNSSVHTINNEGVTPLHMACSVESINQPEIIKTLLDYNADVNLTDCRSDTPLHIAYRNENLQVIELLLKNGANFHIPDDKGRTFLHHVSKNWNLQTARKMELLLEYGADIEAIDNHGWTPLSLVCNHNNHKAIKFFLKHGADPNHTDSKNRTPLHIAVKQVYAQNIYFYKPYKSIPLLIKYGANINILDKKNRTPLHYAIDMMQNCNDSSRHAQVRRRTYESIIKALISQGIKMKTAGLKVINHNTNGVFNSEDYIVIENVKYSVIDMLKFDVVPDSDGKIITNADDSDEEDTIGDLRNLRIRCEREIEEMKKEKISVDGLTFDYLLRKNIGFLSRLNHNEEIHHLLETEIYDKKFPLYIHIVKNRFKKARNLCKRYVLNDKVRDFFKSNVSDKLVDECIDMVLRYFKITELETLIESMEPSND
ncbi:putative ankyrin repeat protein RF_0381 [Chelonus insularis]|uniref:putative ankyrin repeat protein RF_0381 n=1 Tax=Chelonus insularis TaxID=460826 RepID=UPI0015896820|nr:putative ankyrin repeat protein RF_0381 [Chelonus insularis]